MFPAMLEAIGTARHSVRLETYIFSADDLGRKFREALVQARRRGLRVQVLVDSFGSLGLPRQFWQPLIDAGGEARWFNPFLMKRFGYRDHRKILVCDEACAFIGGFNISREYEGDGVTSGWCDLGLRLRSPLAAELAAAFDDMFARASVHLTPFARLRKSPARYEVTKGAEELLLSGPGRGQNPFRRNLRRDLAQAQTVKIMAAYFLPTWRIRHDLTRAARRGARVQLLLPAKSDVLLSQLASRSLYRRLLRAGVEIYEYQPQVLHSKLILVDNLVYAGSSNLDPRSLYINYEVMVRIDDPALAAQGADLFQRKLQHARRIELAEWRRTRTWWRRFKHRWAYFLIARVDPVIARWRYK